MPTITTVDATWDTGVTMDAAELRRADTAMFAGDGSASGVRGGIVRHGDASLAVTVNGSDQVTVQAGAFVIPAASGLGVYRGSLAAATSAVALSSRNGTNPRIDLIVIQAPGIVKTIDGTPGATPSAPVLPAQHIELARVTVPQVAGGAVTVDSSWRTYATALGATLRVPTFARLSNSGHLGGDAAIALDTLRRYTYSGTEWVPDGAYTTVAIGASSENGTINDASGTITYSRVNDTADWYGSITIVDAGSGSGALRFALPFTPIAGQDVYGYGRDSATTGPGLNIFPGPGAGGASVTKYDNTTVIATGRVLRMAGRCRVA